MKKPRIRTATGSENEIYVLQIIQMIQTIITSIKRLSQDKSASLPGKCSGGRLKPNRPYPSAVSYSVTEIYHPISSEHGPMRVRKESKGRGRAAQTSEAPLSSRHSSRQATGVLPRECRQGNPNTTEPPTTQ